MTGITPKQKKEISKYLDEVTWPYIKEKILHEKPDASKEDAVAILYDMEDIYKAEAASFGLSASEI